MDPLRRIMKSAKRPPGDASYLAPYEAATKRHGAGFKATLWATREGQVERFRVIAEMVDLNGCVVVDAGAGCADLARFLHESSVRVARYIGLEGVAEIARAAQCCDVPVAEIVHADFFTDRDVFARLAPDAIVFSGSLNTFQQRDAFEVLDRAWTALLARPALASGPERTLVFNFLSDRCSKDLRTRPPNPARRVDTLAMLDWAFDRTTNVQFRQDYLPEGHDATIAMTVAK